MKTITGNNPDFGFLETPFNQVSPIWCLESCTNKVGFFKYYTRIIVYKAYAYHVRITKTLGKCFQRR